MIRYPPLALAATLGCLTIPCEVRAQTSISFAAQPQRGEQIEVWVTRQRTDASEAQAQMTVWSNPGAKCFLSSGPSARIRASLRLPAGQDRPKVPVAILPVDPLPVEVSVSAIVDGSPVAAKATLSLPDGMPCSPGDDASGPAAVARSILSWPRDLAFRIAGLGNVLRSGAACPDLTLVELSDGRAQTLVSDASGELADPAFSPDGKLVAFVSGPDGERRLEIVDLDGSGRREVTASSSLVTPTWVGSGTIAVVRSGELVLARLSGGEPRVLADSGFRRLAGTVPGSPMMLIAERMAADEGPGLWAWYAIDTAGEAASSVRLAPGVPWGASAQTVIPIGAGLVSLEGDRLQHYPSPEASPEDLGPAVAKCGYARSPDGNSVVVSRGQP